MQSEAKRSSLRRRGAGVRFWVGLLLSARMGCFVASRFRTCQYVAAASTPCRFLAAGEDAGVAVARET